MVLTMSLLMVNRAIYTHIHVMPDGSVVSHAHPFSKSTDDSKGMDHQHSGPEFLLLDQLDILTVVAIAIFVLRAITPSIKLVIQENHQLLPSVVPIIHERGPPASM
jgi:hypothetical protein